MSKGYEGITPEDILRMQQEQEDEYLPVHELRFKDKKQKYRDDYVEEDEK